MRDAAKNAVDSSSLTPEIKNAIKKSLDDFYFAGKPPQAIEDHVKQLTLDQLTVVGPNNEAPPAEKAKANNEQAEKVAQNVTVAATQTNPVQRPSDVSCGIAVLPWSVTRWAFGREVAENFIAVQVTVRNLNDTQQFLVHDVELAVDTQPGIFNRFHSGVDQTTVHGVAATAEEGVSSRTFWLRLLGMWLRQQTSQSPLTHFAKPWELTKGALFPV
jgi:hypothetical protein